MPKSRDPVVARRRILNAAAEECARHGPAGARVDRIAAAAGLNKRMLYHYFGDKAGLVAAVLAEHLDGLEQGAGLDGRGARLLLWALLDPATAADTSRRLRRVQQRAEGRGLLAELLTALGAGPAPGAGPGKPRIRLKHRTGPTTAG